MNGSTLDPRLTPPVTEEAWMARTALITGASRGLGAALAGFLAGQGYDLVVTARDRRALSDLAGALTGVRTIALAGDVADPGHRDRLVEAAATLGGLDLLLNNASTLGPTPLPPLVELPLVELEDIFGVNVLAPLGLVQAALPLLESRGGLIINISSDAALGGYPGWGGYGASKAALDLVSLTLAVELAGRGVSVVSVDPGDMRTAMHQAAYPGEDISDRPMSEATLPFFAWLLGQEPARVSGRRYRAQAEKWELAA
jgi:NAD(P)-dependent dehydrogenase (short-subunit alcohol dehydrogenase family)